MPSARKANPSLYCLLTSSRPSYFTRHRPKLSDTHLFIGPCRGLCPRRSRRRLLEHTRIERICSARLSPAPCIVVVQAGRLEQDKFANRFLKVLNRDVFACNDRSNDQYKEDNQHNKVKDSIAENATPPELGLLHRVNGGSDLTTTSRVSYNQVDNKQKTYLGRSQKSIIECNISILGIKMIGSIMKRIM